MTTALLDCLTFCCGIVETDNHLYRLRHRSAEAKPGL